MSIVLLSVHRIATWSEYLKKRCYTKGVDEHFLPVLIQVIHQHPIVQLLTIDPHHLTPLSLALHPVSQGQDLFMAQQMILK